MQILVSCSYMHREEVAHRDLNPENILVTDVKSDDIFIRISGLETMINIHSSLSVAEQPHSISCAIKPGVPQTPLE